MELIEVTDLRKSYTMGKVEINALNGVFTSIKEGEFIAIMGPSGSGKTTFLNLIGLLDVPTSGKIYLDGKDITKMGSNRMAEYRLRNMGFVFQFFNLFNELTALENVMFPMMLNNVRNYQARAKELLVSVGLADRIHHQPSELSGGQQQRVAIARALGNNPRIVLADEPTGNLDTKSSLEIIGLFRKLNLENRQTILMVTHNPEIGQMADRIVYFRDGKIEERQ